MAKRRFQDRPPGTMAFQHRVGRSDRMSQPTREPVKVTHPDGTVEMVSPTEFDRRRAARKSALRAVRRFREIVAERIEQGLGREVAEVLAWSALEREMPTVWNEARRLYERGERGADTPPHAEGAPAEAEPEPEEREQPEPDEPEKQPEPLAAMLMHAALLILPAEVGANYAQGQVFQVTLLPNGALTLTPEEK